MAFRRPPGGVGWWALVTGSFSGIGKETALAPVAAGFDVARTGRDTSRVTPLGRVPFLALHVAGRAWPEIQIEFDVRRR